MVAAVLHLSISQGKTFSKSLRWGGGRKLYKPITGATKAAPCVLTSAAHGVPDGWAFKISDVVGMLDLNSESRLDNDGYYIATVTGVNTIELSNVNALGFKPYASGGVIELNEPVDLTGYTARLQIRKSIKAPDVLLELTTENGGISINVPAYTITLNISATATAALTWTEGVYELEMVKGPLVVPLVRGAARVTREIAR